MQSGAVPGGNNGVANVLNVLNQAHFPNVDLLLARLDETAARICVVIGELLFHLADAQPIRDQLVRVEAHLILARGSAKGIDIHDARNRFEILLDHPGFERLQVHHVVFGVRAAQRVKVNLSHRTPVRSHLRTYSRRECHLRKPFQNPLAVLEVTRFLAKNHFHRGEPEDGPGANVGYAGNAVHHGFQRDGDLLLDLLGGDAGPLRDDIDVIVGHVGVSLDRQPMKRDNAPGKQQDSDRQHQKTALERKIDQLSNHCASSVSSSARTLPTTCWPGAIPERIAWRPPGNVSPPCTSTR